MKKVINTYLTKLLFPVIEKDIQVKIEELDRIYRHNYWLIEFNYAKLMIKMQEKYGLLAEDSWEIWISKDNPFRKDL